MEKHNGNDTEIIMSKMFDVLHENYKEAVEQNGSVFSQILISLSTAEGFCELIENINLQLVIQEVYHDLLSSVYMAANGMYRNAYICMRSALELTLAVLYFMDHNFDFLLWKQNLYDVKWSTLSDKEKGVLSNRYLGLFVENVDFSLFIENVETMYHICSEYVHGKYEFMQTNFMNMTVKYDTGSFSKWNEYWFKEVKLINCLLSIRLNSKLNQLRPEITYQLKEDAKDMNIGGIINV